MATISPNRSSIELESSLSAAENSSQQDDDHSTERQTHGENDLHQKKRLFSLLGSSILQLPIWGFAMSYGVLQEFFSSTNADIAGPISATGTIGTTFNGVTYISMPLLFYLFVRGGRYSQLFYRRRNAAILGVVLLSIVLLASSFSTHVAHLVVTQGVFAGLGSALMFSPMTLTLGEWHSAKGRALAYGVTLSCKNIVGSACPFLFRVLLDTWGWRNAMRVWMGVVAVFGVVGVWVIPDPPASADQTREHSEANHEEQGRRPRGIPWTFLRHRTFYIYATAILLQSSGYGIPQTYLNTYAHDVAGLSSATATLLLTLFNIPGIIASYFFGYLSDSTRVSLSSSTVCLLNSLGSTLAAFLLWGLAGGSGQAETASMALLILFALIFGFFSGGYSAIWGGFINDIASEAAAANETVDTGMVYGLLNGARGLGYVIGGLVSVPLLSIGMESVQKQMGLFGYGTGYGPLVVFTGLTSAFGGWAVFWRTKRI